MACDELANLKARFERWVVTVDAPDSVIDTTECQLVSHEGQGRKRQQLVLFDAAVGAVDRFRQQENIVDVEVHCATLEELFVALMKSQKSAAVCYPLVKPGGESAGGFANALHDHPEPSVSPMVDDTGEANHE